MISGHMGGAYRSIDWAMLILNECVETQRKILYQNSYVCACVISPISVKLENCMWAITRLLSAYPSIYASFIPSLRRYARPAVCTRLFRALTVDSILFFRNQKVNSSVLYDQSTPQAQS